MIKHNLLLLTCFVILLSQISSAPPKLRIANEFINMYESVKQNEDFNLTLINEAILFVDSKARNFSGGKNPYNVYMGEILNEYAKNLFYGKLNDGNPLIQKAYYFFKLAAAYGNSESLYYLSFYSFYNLDGRFLLKNNYEELPSEERHTTLRSYIKNMNTTTLMEAAHQSSSQGHNASKYLLGSLYLKGRGTEKNCALSSAYFKELGEKHFAQPQSQSYELTLLEATEKRRLDELYFEEDVDRVLPLKDSPQEGEYLSMSTKLGEIPKIMELGYIYYYGLRGERRNFQKAFEYFEKAASKNDVMAKTQVGMMLAKGIGVEQDIERAIGYLEQAAAMEDPRAQTLLGEIYRNGEVVGKNESKAMNYFMQAAQTNYSDALYQYGELLLSQNSVKNLQKGSELVSLAASQGHSLALFRIGLQYMYNNPTGGAGCEIGAMLMKAALERGVWSDKLKEGFYALQKKHYKQAALLYMENALLGIEIGAINAALIIDKHNVFSDEDLDVMRLQTDIYQDPVWYILNSTYNYKPPRDVHDFLLQELSEVLENLEYKEYLKIPQLKQLVKQKPNLSKNYRAQLLVKLLKMGAEDQEPLALLALGDTYQTGKFGEKNDQKAYEHYSQIMNSRIPHFSPNVLAQTFYNLGYMNHKGVGTKKDLPKAIEYYNKANKHAKGTVLNTLLMELASLEKEFMGDQDLTKVLGDGKEPEWTVGTFLKLAVAYFEQKYAKNILIGIMTFAVVVLYLVRMRLNNFVKLNYSQEGKKSEVF